MTGGPPIEATPDFGERIARAATARLGPCAVTRLEVMPGGHSGLTHRAELDVGGSPLSVVVKSTPPGRRPAGRHDVLRQARIIDALASHGDIPVPRLVFEDSSAPPFFGTELVPGLARDPIIDEPLPDESALVVRSSWVAATDLLAGLHAIPPAALGLEGEPIREPVEELAIWLATIRAAHMEDEPAAARLAHALAESAPVRGSTAIVHGDFRLGNLLMDDADPKALIDWEIWSVGDPAVDLGWFVLFTDPDNYPGMGRYVAGTPSADEVVARYLGLVGRDDRGIPWFLALGCFKLAAIQAHNLRRHLEGRYHDAHQERLGPSIERLLELGMHHLERS